MVLWLATAPAPAEEVRSTRAWEPVDLVFHAAEPHPWWEFPVTAEFTADDSKAVMTVAGCWDGGSRWLVRFAAPAPGLWTYRTRSRDRGLDGHSGRIVARAASAAELDHNPNLRGAVRVRPGERHFSYADGTPFLLLADTLWAASTARCGLGEREDGPFFQYLADRQAKGFTAVLLQYFHGYGDYPDAPGHRNEGGKAFADEAVTQLEPAFFAALDRRMRALWDRGLVAAVPTTWWGKTKRNRFTLETALRATAYCAVRYGAFNALWSVAGEYQYVFKDCGWTPADLSALGAAMQQHNPYGRPVSIHPSAQLNWPPPHHQQSSRAFHGEPWLDHHWLQTGQSRDRMPNIVLRLAADRALAPPLPVFCSEAFYETADDPDAAYHARWQAWVAFLNGAAGYGYGAQGLWQFYDPDDPNGEPGKLTRETVPWRQALAFPGSRQLAPVRRLLAPLPWWRLRRVAGGRSRRPASVLLRPHAPARRGRRRHRARLSAARQWRAANRAHAALFRG